MRSHRLFVPLFALTVAVCTAVPGCSSSTGKQTAPPVSDVTGSSARTADGTSIAPSPVSGSTTGQDESVKSAEALARQTAAYSREMTPLIESRKVASGGAADRATPDAKSSNEDPSGGPAGSKRADPTGPNAANAAPQHPPRASQVDWAEPEDLRLSAVPGSTGISFGQNAVPGAPGSHSSPVPVSLEAAGVSARSPSVAPGETASNSPAALAPRDARELRPRSADAIAGGIPPIPPGAEELGKRLDKRVRDYPRDVSAHLDYQLFRFILDEPVPSLGAIASLPSEDRELVAAVLDGMSNFRNTLRADNNTLLSRKVRPILEMADRLRAQADLSIPAIALCTSVRTFGVYEPIEPTRFVAGKGHDVILYCEVENFASQQDEARLWTTKLTKDAVLYTESGVAVWTDRTETVTDQSRHRRRDFFLVKKIRLPSNLVMGRYLLKVSIVDQQASRIAEATLPIVLTAGD